MTPAATLRRPTSLPISGLVLLGDNLVEGLGHLAERQGISSSDLLPRQWPWSKQPAGPEPTGP